MPLWLYVARIVPFMNVQFAYDVSYGYEVRKSSGLVLSFPYGYDRPYDVSLHVLRR